MIRVRTAGRMGNQMFQFAFAYATSRRLNTRFAIGPGPRSSHATLGPPLSEFFDLGPWRSQRLRFERRVEFRLRHGPRPAVVEIGQQDQPAESLGRLRDGVEYAGFFQSEQWFAEHAQEVRRLFTVREPHRREFELRFPDRRPYICMHVRRTDYLDIADGWALPTSYFLDALECVPDREAYEVVVVSDDPDGAAHEFAGEVDVRCSSNPAIIDFQLLLNADVVVASNSSFSWWGAWLNVSDGVRVIAPRHWLGFAAGVEEPVGVIPDRWVSLPVRGAPARRTPLAGA